MKSVCNEPQLPDCSHWRLQLQPWTFKPIIVYILANWWYYSPSLDYFNTEKGVKTWWFSEKSCSYEDCLFFLNRRLFTIRDNDILQKSKSHWKRAIFGTNCGNWLPSVLKELNHLWESCQSHRYSNWWPCWHLGEISTSFSEPTEQTTRKADKRPTYALRHK